MTNAATLPRSASASTSDTDSTPWDAWELTYLHRVHVDDDPTNPIEAASGTARIGWALVVAGEATLHTAETSHRLRSGDAVLVHPRTAYRLVADGAADLVVSDLRLAVPTRHYPSPLIVTDFSSRHRGVAALVTGCPLADVRKPTLFASSYGGLIGASMTASCWDSPSEPAAPADDAAVTAVVAAVTAQPGAAWTVERMSRLVHLSRSALADRFQRTLGRSPAAVLREVRMRHARRLLADDRHPVEYVASRVGYGSTAAFSRAFSHHHGMAPQQWRAQALGIRSTANTPPAAVAMAAPRTSTAVIP